jgi:hypothetical protein
MKTDSQRAAHYNARMLSSSLDPTVAAVNAKAAQNYTTYIVDFYPNQVALRGLLSAGGIMPVKFAAYEAFHGKVYHASKVCSGTALVAVCTALIDVWSDVQHLGPSAATLLGQICTDIYHVNFLGTP